MFVDLPKHYLSLSGPAYHAFKYPVLLIVLVVLVVSTLSAGTAVGLDGPTLQNAYQFHAIETAQRRQLSVSNVPDSTLSTTHTQSFDCLNTKDPDVYTLTTNTTGFDEASIDFQLTVEDTFGFTLTKTDQADGNQCSCQQQQKFAVSTIKKIVDRTGRPTPFLLNEMSVKQYLRTSFFKQVTDFKGENGVLKFSRGSCEEQHFIKNFWASAMRVTLVVEPVWNREGNSDNLFEGKQFPISVELSKFNVDAPLIVTLTAVNRIVYEYKISRYGTVYRITRLSISPIVVEGGNNAAEENQRLAVQTKIVSVLENCRILELKDKVLIKFKTATDQPNEIVFRAPAEST